MVERWINKNKIELIETNERENVTKKGVYDVNLTFEI